MTFKIALIPGDGIGPEVLAQARKVLEALRTHDFEFEAEVGLAGGASIDAVGEPMPPSTMQLVLSADAVLLGAVGDLRYEDGPIETRSTKAILDLRVNLGSYASLCQVVVPLSVAAMSPLQSNLVAGLDILIVRELAGDVYMTRERGQRHSPDGPFAGDAEGYDMMRYARGEVVRVARVAFEAARRRRSRLMSVDKANVLETSRLWRRVVTELAKEYPDVAVSHVYADNAAIQLIRQPREIDVMLTGNMFGDILSDVASVLTGSIGLPASAMLGDPGPTLYEAGHGSAPDIAGQNRANPIACIRAAALMLRMSLQRPDLADRIERAIGRVLDEGLRTADIYTPGTHLAGTEEMGDAIVLAVETM